MILGITMVLVQMNTCLNKRKINQNEELLFRNRDCVGGGEGWMTVNERQPNLAQTQRNMSNIVHPPTPKH